MRFSYSLANSSPAGGRGSFFRSLLGRLRGTRGYTMAHAWAPARLRSACSGDRKSSVLARIQGIASRPAESRRPVETSKIFLFSVFHHLLVSVFRPAAVSEAPQQRSKARQPRGNTSRASSFSFSRRDSVVWCVRECAILASYIVRTRNTVSRRETKFHLFTFCFAICRCVPVSHR